MPLRHLVRLVIQNILRNKKNFVFSSIGILVGVTLLTFFLALSAGIRAGVINRVYPINQVELEPMSVNLVGFKSEIRNRGMLDRAAVDDLAGIPGVMRLYPKQRAKLASMFKGGAAIFGFERYFEAFFDGLEPALLWDELQEKERVGEKRARRAGREAIPCDTDLDCKPGYECREGGCQPVEYWRQFRYGGQALPCQADDGCVEGEGCIAGRCEPLCDGSACVDGARCVVLERAGTCGGAEGCGAGHDCQDGECVRRACLPVCASDGDCTPGEACVPPACGDAADCVGSACADGACALAGLCRPLPCRLPDAKSQDSDRCDVVQGSVALGCDPTAVGESCPAVSCPEGTYCATASAVSREGTCQLPVPVLLSPFLLEIYNSVAAPQMNAPRIDGAEAMLGLEIRVSHGESMITQDMRPEQRVVRRARVVGFSDKALDLGVTAPLDYVRRVNAHFKGRSESNLYDTVILQTRGNEDVSRVTMAADERGFTLSRKSQDARKAGTMLFILTLVFTVISVVILLIAAINITHTFLMIIYERKHELGIMRAIGASRSDIRRIVLGEAGFIGLFGGALGNAFAYGLSRIANALAGRYLTGVPFRPDDLFAFTPELLFGAVGFALAFCLVGAFFPANRAARLDPAAVLTMR